jgi:frataxin-like iron-binding protein CyaY
MEIPIMPQATLDNQAIPSLRDATRTESSAFAFTCATCPYFQSHNDGTNKGWCKLFNRFARETHQLTQDCTNTIEDELSLAQAELDQYIEIQAAVIAPEIEIDSVELVSGTLYRVWKSYHFLGTFYQSLDGLWISQPYNTTQRASWATDTQAVNAILTA